MNFNWHNKFYTIFHFNFFLQTKNPKPTVIAEVPLMSLAAEGMSLLILISISSIKPSLNKILYCIEIFLLSYSFIVKK